MINRKKTILIASVVILIIAVAIYFFFIRKSPENQPALQKQPDSTTEEVEAGPQIIQSQQTQELATPEESEYGQVKNFAVSFVERFGSYSNQADFQNLVELKFMMTEKMKTWADDLISTSREDNPISENYYAQTTKALSTKEISYDAASGRAEFLIKSQRQEIVNSPTNVRTYYQDIKITLVKIADDWKVDSADWQ